jgi:hypothetical protein
MGYYHFSTAISEQHAVSSPPRDHSVCQADELALSMREGDHCRLRGKGATLDDSTSSLPPSPLISNELLLYYVVIDEGATQCPKVHRMREGPRNQVHATPEVAYTLREDSINH